MIWHPFDYDKPHDQQVLPLINELVWVVEDFYHDGDTTTGYWDGDTWRMWHGHDDCSVSFWARIEYPLPPPRSGPS